ncbi:MAG: class I SAM-dependent methyltransferase [bacterium]
MAQAPWKTLASRVPSPERRHYQERRRGFLSRYVSLEEGRGLEFGAFDLPTVPRDVGHCDFADVRSECALSERFDVPMENICQVDCIVDSGRPLQNQIHGRFDYLVLCHVLEHIPDVIAALNDLAELLVEGGTLFLALPDKRETPDISRDSTRISRLIERHVAREKKPSLSEIADFALAWRHEAQLDYRRSIRKFFESVAWEIDHGDPDVHCNVWQDDELFDQIRELIRGGYLPKLELIGTHPTESPFNEFYLALRRPPDEPGSGALGVVQSIPSPRRDGREELPRYRTCNFCGHARFEAWTPDHLVAQHREGTPYRQAGTTAVDGLGAKYLTCQNCGLTGVNPLPPTLEMIPNAGRRLSNVLGGTGLEALLDHDRQVMQWLSEQFEFDRYRRNGRLLEIGCGHGAALAWLRDRRGWDVHGIETDGEMVEYAAAHFGLKAHWNPLCDAREIAGPFDLIVLNESLQSLPDPLGSLLVCHDLLRENGCLVVLVPSCEPSISSRALRGDDLFAYSPSVMQRILGRIGYVTDRILVTQEPGEIGLSERASAESGMPAEELQVVLEGEDTIERSIGGEGLSRADRFGMRARRAPEDERERSEKDRERARLRNVSRAFGFPRRCVFIDHGSQPR